MDNTFYCKECNLMFPNIHLFEKHKKKFCPHNTNLGGLNVRHDQALNFDEPEKLNFSNKGDLAEKVKELELRRAELAKQLRQLGFDEENSVSITHHHSSQQKKASRKTQEYGRPPNHKIHNKPFPAWDVWRAENIQLESENRLLDEVRRMQEEYLQNGGNDAEIVDYFKRLCDEVGILRKKGEPKLKLESGNEELRNLAMKLESFEERNNHLQHQIEELTNKQKFPDRQSKAGEVRSDITNIGLSNIGYVPNIVTHQLRSISRANNNQHPVYNAYNDNHNNNGNYHDRRLHEMRQETEYYRQQLELEHLRQELYTLRGNPNKPVLPAITGNEHHQHQIQHQLQQLQQLQYNPHNLNKPNEISTENHFYDTFKHKQNEAFQLGPYDPASGFTIFWDFVHLPTLTDGYCQLIVTLYKDEQKISETRTLPLSPFGTHRKTGSSPWGYNGIQRVGLALLGVKQNFPKCFPDEAICLVVCLQIVTGDGDHANQSIEDQLLDYGWFKIKLFDPFKRIISGRWKAPIRVLPVRQDITMADMNSLVQLGQAEVYFRLINTRDNGCQDDIIIDQQMMTQYKFTPIDSYINFKMPQVTLQAALPSMQQPENHTVDAVTRKLSSHIEKKGKSHPMTSKLSSSESKSSLHIKNRNADRLVIEQDEGIVNSRLEQEIPEEDVTEEVLASPEIVIQSLDTHIGVQIDKLVDVSIDEEVKVVFSIRNPNGQVAFCDCGGAIFTTNWTRPTFLHRVHLFGLQEKLFQSVQLFRWSVLYIQVFIKSGQGGDSIRSGINASSNHAENEKLVAWTAFVLFGNIPVSQSLRNNAPLKEEMIKYGDLRLQLFQAPTPSFKTIMDHVTIGDSSGFQKADATITLCLFKESQNKQIFSNALWPDPLQTQIPEGSWIEYERPAPTRTFKNGNGFDFYVDAGKFFPDTTVISKVIIGLFDRTHTTKKSVFYKTMETGFALDTNAEEPVFDSRFEFRDFAYDAQTKFVITVYILNNITRKSSVYGYAILPLFVLPNTFETPGTSSLQYCLNEGCMQLRLYQFMNDQVNFDENKLRGPIPCSSLLVRLLPAACYSDGQCKTQREIPEDEWINEGINVPMPKYEEGVYDSIKCRPEGYEIELIHHFAFRKVESVRNKLYTIVPDGKKSRTDQGLMDWLKTQFKNVEQSLPFQMNLLMNYSSLHGLFICLEKCQNISWNGLTFATFCLSPPCSFYEGSNEDSLIIVRKVNKDSSIRHVSWLDDVKVFPRRNFSSNFAVVVQLYEVKEKLGKFFFIPQAWTLLPLTTSGYLLHGYFQIPLFQGIPTETILQEIQRHPLIPTIANLRKKKMLRIMDAMSVFLRVGDARRIYDGVSLATDIADQTFLPKNNKFSNVLKSKPIQTIAPVEAFDQYVNECGDIFEQFIIDTFEQRGKK